MKIYNTLTRQKEEFKTIKGNKVGIYVCGPTVYNYIHVGNARPICVFDVLRRFLEYKKYDVTFVQNFTDVDDKIIKKSNEENVDASFISEKYIEEYKKDSKGLNVRPADIQPKVTENIDSIIELVKNLIEKDFAYEANGDVYFRTKNFSEYGKLSKMPLEDLKAGARVDVSDVKEDVLDFALWKSAKEGEPFWQSPWGKGRPGWHIECSAMSKKFIGETLDIHCGGQDLIFPHHENEIAQSEAVTGKVFANYWMHNGHINVDNKKMSKSLGNFFTLREVAEKYSYEVVRYLMIQAHYRMPINYSVELLNACKSSLDRLYSCKETLERAIANAVGTDISDEANAIFENRKTQFVNALDDDLNTADALSAIFELVREINIMILDEKTSKKQLETALSLFNELTSILGICYNEKSEEIPEEILLLVQKRKDARKNKDFALADKIRDEIADLGYIVEETRQGINIKKG